jgi:beta-phosphoglucomutase-like phosphatase (HAD superfamily)
MNRKNDHEINKAAVKAVVFDMDGTMIDTERAYLETHLRCAAFFGLPLEREYFIEHFTGRRTDVYNEEFTKLRGDKFDKDIYRNKAYELYAEYIKHNPPQAKK